MGHKQDCGGDIKGLMYPIVGILAIQALHHVNSAGSSKEVESSG